MNNINKLRCLIAVAGLSALTQAPRALYLAHSGAYAAEAVAPATPANSLLGTDDAFLKSIKPSSAQVSVALSTDPAAPGLIVTVQPGNDGYPGITITPPGGGTWDFSKFGHLEARVTNTGTKDIPVNLRVDDSGPWQDNPWNAENTYLKPGKTGTVTTIFGYSYGHKPAHKLNSSSVPRILLFVGKSDVVQTFRIESLVAAGPAGEAPAVDPGSIRIKPKGGFILGPGADVDAAQLSASGGQATLATGTAPGVRLVFPVGPGNQFAAVKSGTGRWDLRDYTEVNVALRNEGKSPVTPRVRLETNGGPTDWITAAPIAPGAASVVTIPFRHAIIPDFAKKETVERVSSDAVSAVAVAVDNAPEERDLLIQSIQATETPAVVPSWLGKRPPVEGAWTQTLNEDFNAPTLDKTIWDDQGPNYYDKATHWSKDDLLLGDGLAKLHYEKKTGFQNDDPTANKTNYAAGYLTSYGKWTQRYGYFESRMKLPKAPGLWPAFWMMPDRGAAAGEQWKRQDTANGAMELDIMEHLTRWGGHRYNIAQHWDGYGKQHKSNGSDAVYVNADKDGYITAGVLWTPGSLVYYCNGLEVAHWEDPRISSVESCFLFTLPSGGWDNNPLDDARLPADFVIDYVRAWQRQDLASPADGKQAPAAAKP